MHRFPAIANPCRTPRRKAARPAEGRRAPATRHAAFTLTELLVSVAIVLILAASGWYAFAHTRDAARRTSDLSDIRQLETACGSFAAEYGHYPDSFQIAGKTWDLQLFPYLGMPEVSAQASSGLLNRMDLPTSEVFGAAWDQVPRKAGGITRGFAMAGWICNAIEGKNGQPGPYTASWGVTWPNHHGAKPLDIKRPSSYILLTPIGKGFQNPLNVVGAGSYALSDWPGDSPDAWPYGGSGPFAFCDGSTRILRRQEFENNNDFRRKHADNK